VEPDIWGSEVEVSSKRSNCEGGHRFGERRITMGRGAG
jgi:hypothetical protein